MGECPCSQSPSSAIGSARRDPAGRLALFPVHPELSGYGGNAGPARHRGQLRDRLLLDPVVRPVLRTESPTVPGQAHRPLAPGRNGGEDRRQEDVAELGPSGLCRNVTAVTGMLTFIASRFHKLANFAQEALTLVRRNLAYFNKSVQRGECFWREPLGNSRKPHRYFAYVGLEISQTHPSAL